MGDEKHQAAVGAATEAVDAAQAALYDLGGRIRQAEAEATRTVRDRFADETQRLSAAAATARQRLAEIQNAAEDHPWAGKRVRYRTQSGRWGLRQEKVVDGVVEMRRLGTVFPDNTPNYRLPAIGEPFVRLLKKDGSPGARFDKLSGLWKLVEP